MNKCLLGDKPNIQRCHLLSYIGRIYSKAGDNDRALNYHLQVVQMYESIFLSEFSAPLHSFDLVAYDYRQKKDYKKALEYLNKALYLIEVLHDDHLNVTCLYTLAHAGGLYIDLNDMQKASYYYNKLLESCFTTLLNNENNILYGISYAGLGRICLKQAEAEKGIAYLEKALTIMQTHFPDDHSELLPLLIDLISPLQKIDSLKAKEYQQWTERIKEKNERVRSLLLSKK